MLEEITEYKKLTELKKTPDFSAIAAPNKLPEGYLADFSEKIIQKIKITDAVDKKRNFSGGSIHIFSKHWLKTAVAAVFIFSVFGILWQLQFFNKTQTGNAEMMIRKMSNDRLENFLKETGVYNTSGSEEFEKMDENLIDFNQFFQNIPDKDLKTFLNETSGEDENISLN
ncbi:MAG: hypothetical protein IPH58_10290 [Sphingobacteriales bacterium]|jgi:hypothetical protein|nr:hypothetical protein [Sphingobacteriales bacterium]